ncbi:MAG: hypothetical protein ACOCZV_01480 [Nanoarchaeota archaeon]
MAFSGDTEKSDGSGRPDRPEERAEENVVRERHLHEHDIYDLEYVDSMLDNDELSDSEAAFMKGYEDHN